MAVRFVAGRAGSGKTFHCLESIRSLLAQDAVDGPRLIFLVPEQASLQMERAILAPAGSDPNAPGDSAIVEHSARATGPSAHQRPAGTGATAAHRAEVLSFQRLAYRVLEHVGGSIRPALTEPARAMVLRHLLRREGPRLRFYRRVNAVGGFIDRLSATIAGLIQENVSPEELADGQGGGTLDNPDDASPTERADPHQAAKLHDLSIVYREYLEFLDSGWLDPSQHLQVARSLLPQCEWINGARLWVDGFASFSEQETLTLLELLRRSTGAEITMLLDPALAAGRRPAQTGCAGGAGADAIHQATAERLFGRPYETFERLRKRIREAGVEEAAPLVLAPSTMPRFTGAHALSGLERRLFTPAIGGPQSEKPQVAAPAYGVQVVELPSRRVEVDYAVAQVCSWVQDAENPLRYRDIALIVRDLEPYHDLLAEALRSRGIPFFIDRRRPVTHHPLVEFVRAGLAVASEDLSLDALRRLLKTDLAPVTRSRADELENFLLAHGIAGRHRWESPWSITASASRRPADEDTGGRRSATASALNESREQLLGLLLPWLDFALPGARHDGPAWSAALTDLLERARTGDVLARWAEEAGTTGELEVAEEHQQAWAGVMGLLDDLAFALKNEALAVDELADVVDAGLATLTLGLVPPTVDQVLVGSIERSRHPDLKAAVILGFNDATFPKRISEDSILNDDDRTMLRDRGLRVGPGASERVVDEALLLYIAVTRPSRQLVVSYAAADDSGRTLRPSPYFDALRAACPGLVHRSVGHPVRQRTHWDVLCTADLRRRLTEEFRSRPEIRSDDPVVRTFWNRLYACERERLRSDRISPVAFRSLGEPRRDAGSSHDEARLSDPMIRRLLGSSLRTSVSRLESYAACPFQYFAKYVLRLDERAEALLEAVDVGQVDHAILEDFVGGVVRSGRTLADLGGADLAEGLRASCQRVSADLLAEGLLDARNAHVLRRSARHLARVLESQRRTAAAGRARPFAAELAFGLAKEGGLPPVEIRTPKGRTITLRGLIDRVDLVDRPQDSLGIVIDYKATRDKKLDLNRVYLGLSLQLPAYLLALAEAGAAVLGRPIRPGAALFVSLAPRYKCVDHPDQLSARDAVLRGTFRAAGVLSEEAAEALDGDQPGWSPNYRLYRGKEGFGHRDRSDIVDGDGLEAILSHTRRTLGELADGILDGDMRVRPCRISNWRPCNWCPMTGVCRVELGLSEMRFAEPAKRSEVLARIAAERSGAS